MQTLIPQPVTAFAQFNGRFGRALGFSLTPRALLLLLAANPLSIPAFFHPHRLWLMFAWDALIAALVLTDLSQLPPPSAISVTRRFVHSPALGNPTEIVHEMSQVSKAFLQVLVTDNLHSALIAKPQTRSAVSARVAERSAAACRYSSPKSRRSSLDSFFRLSVSARCTIASSLFQCS